MNQHNYDIALVQDYHTAKHSFTGLLIGWAFYHSLQNTAGILIANPLLFHIQSNVFDNSVFINPNIKNDSIKLESQYSVSSGVIISDLEDWSNNISNCNNLILGGDFNAHLQAWGYKKNNARGEAVQDYISLNDLYVINDPKIESRYQINNIKGNPDLQLRGLEARQLFYSWEVDTKSESLSDHLYIKFTLNAEPALRNNYRFRTKYANFKKFNTI